MEDPSHICVTEIIRQLLESGDSLIGRLYSFARSNCTGGFRKKMAVASRGRYPAVFRGSFLVKTWLYLQNPVLAHHLYIVIIPQTGSSSSSSIHPT